MYTKSMRPCSRVSAIGSVFRVLNFGFRVPYCEFRVACFGFRVSSFGFRIPDLNLERGRAGKRDREEGCQTFLAQGLGIMAQGSEVRAPGFQVPGFGKRA